MKWPAVSAVTRLPRRETPILPGELASDDVESAVRLLARLSVSFAGLASDAMRRAICLSSVKTGMPIVIVARPEGEVAGIAVAIYDTDRFWRRFFLRHPYLALAVLPRRLPVALRSRAQATKGPSWSEAGPRIAKALFLGVAPEHRSRGLATRVYSELLARLARRGVSRVDGRIHPRNMPSLRLHVRMGGWTLRRDERCVFVTRSLR
jgi:ribosomal protein S18 acetylase RimI-like enzyme